MKQNLNTHQIVNGQSRTLRSQAIRDNGSRMVGSIWKTRYDKSLLLIAGIAFILRAAPVLRSGTGWAGINQWDSAGYIELAHGLQHCGGFAREVEGSCSAPELLRTPGYPAFLAIVPPIRAVILLQALAGAFLCWAVGFFAGKRWGKRAGIIASLLTALDVASIIWSSQIMSEALFQFMLGFAVMAVVSAAEEPKHVLRVWLLGASSLLLVFVILLKPLALVVAISIPIPLLLVTNSKFYTKLASVALVLVFPVVTMVAWTARNRAVAGISTFSSISIKNLLDYRAAGVLSRINNKTIEEERRVLHAQAAFPPGFSMLSEGPVLTQSPAALERAEVIGETVLLQHPAAFFRMTIRDLLYMAWTPGLGDIKLWLSGAGAYGPSGQDAAVSAKLGRFVESSAPVIAVSLIQEIVLALIWMGSAVSLVWALRYKNWQLLWFLGVGLLVLLAAAGPEGGARLRMPAIPILAIVAAAGFAAYPIHGSLVARADSTETSNPVGDEFGRGASGADS